MAVQLEVLGAEADQQIAPTVLCRCFGRRAYELERRATKLEGAVVGFALIAVAVNPATRTASATADAISDLRRFT